jgi:cytochrome c oxidase subunit 1
MSIIIRMELSKGETYIVSNRMYIVIVTLHGIIMIFFMVMPSMMGFMANYIIPISLIVPDMAYPRLNNISL